MVEQIKEKRKGATLTQIARESGVSVAVVSRLFSGDRKLNISEGKREEIFNIRNQLGGVRATNVGRKRMKGLAYNIAWPINRVGFPVDLPASEFFRNFETTLEAKGFKVSMTFFDEAVRFENHKKLIASPDYCDGIVLGGGTVDAALAGLLRETSFPHISIDPNEERFGVNTISMHALNGLRDAINHLQSLGHRQIGYVGPRAYRFPLYVAVMTEANLSLAENYHCFTPMIDNRVPLSEYQNIVARSFGQWLSEGHRPTALICHNDYTAFGVMRVMQEHGLQPGKDISLVGFDNIEERGPEYADQPVLTTIDNPSDLTGKRAAELLVYQISDNQRQIFHEHLPVKLIVRQTTGPVQNRI